MNWMINGKNSLGMTILILAATVCGVALQGAGRDMDQGGRGEWPFIVIRHGKAINDYPMVFEQLIDCHRRYRGACDEFWFATGDRKTPDMAAKACADFARFRPLCD